VDEVMDFMLMNMPEVMAWTNTAKRISVRNEAVRSLAENTVIPKMSRKFSGPVFESHIGGQSPLPFNY
jgi:hypothetical protein